VPVYKSVVVKIFAPGNKSYATRLVRAERGKGFTEEGISEVLLKYADWVDKTYWGHEYRCVQLAPNAFNFVNVK
jgi:hypothetical protein